jgi:serine/threonine-protein kinase HipA
MPFRAGSVLVSGQLAGLVEETERGYRFSYHPVYLKNAEAIRVSLTLPLRAEPYESKVLFPFFDGLIPEGWLLEVAERTWKLNPRDRMGLLLACCADCIGNVSVTPLENQA